MGLLGSIKDRMYEGAIGQYCIAIIEEEQYGSLMGDMPDTPRNLGMDIANAALNFYKKERVFYSNQRPTESTMAALGFAILSNIELYSRSQRSAFNDLSRKHKPNKDTEIELSDIDERLCHLTDETLDRNPFTY